MDGRQIVILARLGAQFGRCNTFGEIKLKSPAEEGPSSMLQFVNEGIQVSGMAFDPRFCMNAENDATSRWNAAQLHGPALAKIPLSYKANLAELSVRKRMAFVSDRVTCAVLNLERMHIDRRGRSSGGCQAFSASDVRDESWHGFLNRVATNCTCLTSRRTFPVTSGGCSTWP